MFDSSEENHPLYGENQEQNRSIKVAAVENGNIKQNSDNKRGENNIKNSEKYNLITDSEANDSSQLDNQQQQQSPKQRKNIKNSFSNVRDLKAMSVASIYDKENQEMNDADNDITGLKRSESYQSHPADCESCYNSPPDPFTDSNTLQTSLFFTDGNRSIDFVLVWQTDDDDATQEELASIKREIFEKNLVNEGLEIERETFESLNFVKIHAPIEVLRRYSEILKLRMPMKKSLCQVHERNRLSKISSAVFNFSQKIPGLKSVRSNSADVCSCSSCMNKVFTKHILVDEEHFPPRLQGFTAVYSRDKEYLFDIHHKCFFTAAIRSRIVQFILDRKRFTLGADDDFSFGIDRLIDDGVYVAAYPLHDGEISVPGSVRHLLYTQWAAISKWYRYQPLDYIKEYFGVKIGLYFAWLGFYTYMLMLASIVGVACFIYSLLTMDDYRPSQEICTNSSFIIKMCPLCDQLCDYWDLTCRHVKTIYLFDNPTTVFFAIFMSFWATLFLELWKRYSAEITHRWDLTGFDIHEEHPRPQYLARLAHVKKHRIDYVTMIKEPQPPFWRMKLPATVFSFSVVVLLVTLAIAAVIGVVFYRMSILAVLNIAENWKLETSQAFLFTTVSAASINLCLIVIFNYIYTFIAEWLTEFEILRTQTEFDDSLTLKIYLLQFVNYYASIFYIAFFKGRFVGTPGKYKRFFNYRQEECGVGGCLMELCIQLAIIMIGKQTMNAVLEMMLPIFYKWYYSAKIFVKKNKRTRVGKDAPRYIRDLKLIEWGPRSLFPEYLEMVLQYGFVTIFVAAFPLAPFFALLNNILEMRLDAKKLLTHFRRPVSQRVRDIGVWYRILDCIGKLAVITNGLIIAFTSDFIPRLIYRLYLSPDHSLTGYIDFSLAKFNTSDFPHDESPAHPKYPVTECRYPNYRESDSSDHVYWMILAARLAFVVIFENFVAVVMILVRWGIPDMSTKLRDQIRREAYITNEIIIKQEARRARAEQHAIADPSETSKRMQHLLSGNLSRSQLDLVMHGPDDPTGPGHTKPKNKYENVNRAFIETEKIHNRKDKANDRDNIEMSSL